MKNDVITAIDLGTAVTRGVMLEDRADEGLYVVAAASAPAAGMRRGDVIAPERAADSVADVLRALQLQSGISPHAVTFGLGSAQMHAQRSKGVVVVSRADNVITDDDVERALTAAQAVSLPANQDTVHALPRAYVVDNQASVKDPRGMRGVRLEVDALLVDAPIAAQRAVEAVAQDVGVSVEAMVATPLATAIAVLDQQQRELGAVVIDIGAATTKIAVYEEDELIHVAVVPIGAAHVTNDLAIGLRTAVETAEAVKLNYGIALVAAADRREECDLAAIDAREEGFVSRVHIAEIVQARMEEIFSLVQKELEAIGKAELLPAGAILVGGGAKIPYCVPLAKEVLRLPVRIGEPQRLPGVFDRVDDPAYATVLGLAQWVADDPLLHSATGGIQRSLADVTARIRGLFGKIFP